MKLLSAFLIFSMLFSPRTFSQGGSYNITLEDTGYLHHIILDSTSTWQIGPPQKSYLNSAISPINVIITDTINSYPVNDTSYFLIQHIAYAGFSFPHTAVLEGYYSVESDTLTDFGTIEFSPDNGLSWYDIVSDTFFTQYLSWTTPIPVLSGNSNGWQHFHLYFFSFTQLFNISIGDTVLFRFTFISDNVQTNKDGLMFDSFTIEDWFEDIEEMRQEADIQIFPVPAYDHINLVMPDLNTYQLKIFNNYGREVRHIDELSEKIDVGFLPPGYYIFVFQSENYRVQRPLIITR